MRKASNGRKSSLNPVRVSTLAREEKGTNSARSEMRRTSQLKSLSQPSSGENSGIPRPRIRSDSSERNSMRKSNLKPLAKTPISVTSGSVQQTGSTPRVSSIRVHADLPSGLRGRSPSAERASGLNTQKGAKKDNRPLNDKNFQMMMLNRIDNFFKEVNETGDLNSNGSIKPMSLKIFVSTSDYLLKFLDMKPNLTSANYMEELPKFAKKLKYPAPLAKSWLKTANTMHSWPHVLGWLSWLVEICILKECASERFQLETLPFVDTEDNYAEIHRSLFLALMNMYKVWNDGKEEEETQLEEDYVKSVADQIGFTEDVIENLQLELDELREKNRALDEKSEEIELKYKAAREKNEALKKDEEKQLKHIEDQKRYKQKVESEIKKLDMQKISLKKENEEYIMENEKLISIIASQPMNADERDAIDQQCSERRKRLNQVNDHLEQVKKDSWALDTKFSVVNEGLHKASLAYNRDIVLKVPHDMGVTVEELLLPESSFLQPGMMELFKSKAEAMTKFKDTLTEQAKKLESLVKKKSHQLGVLQEKKKAIDQEKYELDMKNDEAKQTIKQIKIQAKEDEAKLQEQIKKLQDDIKYIKESTPDIEAATRQLAELEETLEARTRKKVFLEQSGVRFFSRFYEIIGSHENDMRALCDKIRDFDPNKKSGSI